LTPSAGTRLGPYEIVSPLGAGGMGEVWRARDTRLAREVAIKILPAEVAADASRLKRFEKEARAASALNHPNIVTIYDVGSVDSVSYIAMERVDGKTLRELLFGGALPIRKLLPIAAQIADGLAKAHEAGIVHRDLKPENVMVTKDGLVKILDFGLAKLTHPELDSGGTNLPTETGTSPGMILGTVGYMSPEQASGEIVDFQSDQFSFGSILYEMATGKRAFQKKTAVDTLSAILNEEPAPIGNVNSQAPAPLRWVVERCLAKDPEARYASTKDLARELAAVRDHLSKAFPSGATASPTIRRRRVRLAALSVALGLLALGLLAGRWIGSAKSSSPRFRQATFRRGVVWRARFAPDGQTIVFGMRSSGRPAELFMTVAGSAESRPLSLASADVRSISSSGEMLILLGDSFGLGTLARVPLSGGAPREIVENAMDGDWAPDGKNFSVVRRVGSKTRLEYPLGKILYETDRSLHSGRFSPDGNLLLIREGDDIAVVDTAGNKRTVAKRPESEPAGWAPSGKEIWFTESRDGATYLQAITVNGKERLVATWPGDDNVQDISKDGRLLVERVLSSEDIIGLAPGESRERNLSWLANSAPADLSANGKTLLFTDMWGFGESASGSAVYVRDTNGSDAVRLGEGIGLALSTDGKWALAFQSGPSPRLVLLPTKAGEIRALSVKNVVPEPEPFMAAFWSADGRRILFSGHEAGHPSRCYVFDVSSETVWPITPEGIRACKTISPDGARVCYPSEGRHAFCSAQKGEIFSSQPIPGIQKGDLPIRWSADGRSLYVRSAFNDPLFFGEPVWEPSAKIYRLDLASGRRELWKELLSSDSMGGGGIQWVLLSADGKSWVYSSNRLFSNLFIVEGLK
jgi:serine/threonine protein kinase/Tol biopolymer transport system component